MVARYSVAGSHLPKTTAAQSFLSLHNGSKSSTHPHINCYGTNLLTLETPSRRYLYEWRRGHCILDTTERGASWRNLGVSAWRKRLRFAPRYVINGRRHWPESVSFPLVPPLTLARSHVGVVVFVALFLSLSKGISTRVVATGYARFVPRT